MVNIKSITLVLLWIAALACLVIAVVYPVEAQSIEPIETKPRITYVPAGEIEWRQLATSGDEIIISNTVNQSTTEFYITPDPLRLKPAEISNFPIEAFYLVYTGTGPERTARKIPITALQITEIPKNTLTPARDITRDKIVDLTRNDGVRVTVNDIAALSGISDVYLKFSVHSATYSAVSNTITVTGTSTQLRADIYAADIANGWGVHTRCGTYCYCTAARVDIGDGATATDVSDKFGAWYFSDIYGTNGWDNYIYIHNNATATFGIVTDSGLRTTENGINFIFEDNNDNKAIQGNGDTAIGYFNSCTFTGIGDSYLLDINTGHAWNCLMTNAFGFHSCGSNYFELYGCHNHNGNFPLINHYDYAGIKSLYMSDSKYYQIYETTSGTYTNVNATRSGLAEVYSSSNTGPIKLFDCYTYDRGWDDWRINWGGVNTDPIYRYHSFDLTVTDNGTPIQNANVVITTATGTTVATLGTSATGTITTVNLELGRYEPGTQTLSLRSPHTIEITKHGYETYTDRILMNEAMAIQVSLLPINTGTTAGDVLSWCQNNIATISWWEENMTLVINTVLFLGLALLALWAYKRRIGWLSVVAGISVMTIATSVVVDSGAAYGFPYVVVGIGVFIVGLTNIRKMA